MKREVEFLFDYGSPFSYLASLQIEGFAKRSGATVTYGPILLGAISSAKRSRTVCVGAPIGPSSAVYSERQHFSSATKCFGATIASTSSRRPCASSCEPGCA